MSIMSELGAVKKELEIKLNGATEFLVSESFLDKLKKPFVKVNQWLDSRIFYTDELIVIEDAREELVPSGFYDRIVNWIDKMFRYDYFEIDNEDFLSVETDEKINKKLLNVDLDQEEKEKPLFAKYSPFKETDIFLKKENELVSPQLKTTFTRIVISFLEKTFFFYQDENMVEIEWEKELINNYINQNIDILRQSDIMVEIIRKDSVSGFSSNVDRLNEVIERVFKEEEELDITLKSGEEKELDITLKSGEEKEEELDIILKTVEEKEEAIVNVKEVLHNQEQLSGVVEEVNPINKSNQENEINDLKSKQILLFDQYKFAKDYDEKELFKMQLYQVGQKLRDLNRLVELEKVIINNEDNLSVKIEELKKQRSLLVFASKNKYEHITEILDLDEQLDNLKLQQEKTELIDKVEQRRN